MLLMLITIFIALAYYIVFKKKAIFTIAITLISFYLLISNKSVVEGQNMLGIGLPSISIPSAPPSTPSISLPSISLPTTGDGTSTELPSTPGISLPPSTPGITLPPSTLTPETPETNE